MGAIAATNTYLQVQTAASPATWQTLGEVKNINGPNYSATMQDTSTHSLTVPWRTRIPTLLDIGDITFDINYDPGDSTHDATTGFKDWLENRTLKTFRVVYPDNTTFAGRTADEFQGYVSRFSIQAAVDGILAASVTISGTGQPTFDQTTT